MKITEILIEEQQLTELPLGSIGRGIGKAVGGLAKGAGAVAGGIAGIGRAAKKGYQVGKATVAGDPVPDQEAPDSRQSGSSKQSMPASGGGRSASAGAAPAGGGTTGATTNVNVQGGSAQSTVPAPQAGAAPAASASAASAKAGQTLYAQVKANVNQLDKKGKQRILQLLQKSLTQPAAAAPAAPTTGPGSKTAGTTPSGQPRVEPDLNAPTEKPATKPTDAGKKKPGKTTGPSQAEIDADRERLMGPTSDSIVRTGNNLSEDLATKIEQHKRKMFETGLSSGQSKIFVR